MELEVYRQAHRLKDSHWWFLGRKRVISVLLREYLKRKDFKILDVGCGAATSLPILISFGKVYGLDRAKTAINFCQKKGYNRLVLGSATKLPFNNTTFDLVCALDLLEHVKNDQVAIGEFARVCKKGGWLAVTVPAFSFLWGENDVATHHFRRYNKKELETKLRVAGFKIKKISYFNLFPLPLFSFWHFQRLMQRNINKNEDSKSMLSLVLPKLINRCLTALFSLEAIILPKVSFLFGVSLFCLAQKE